MMEHAEDECSDSLRSGEAFSETGRGYVVPRGWHTAIVGSTGELPGAEACIEAIAFGILSAG